MPKPTPSHPTQTRIKIQIQGQLHPLFNVHYRWKTTGNYEDAGGWSAHLNRLNAHLNLPTTSSNTQFLILFVRSPMAFFSLLRRLYLTIYNWVVFFGWQVTLFSLHFSFSSFYSIHVLGIHAFPFISGLRYCFLLSQLWKNRATSMSTAQLKGLFSSPKRPPFWRFVHIQTFILFSSLYNSKYLMQFLSFCSGVLKSIVEQIFHGLVGEDSVLHQFFDFPGE